MNNLLEFRQAKQSDCGRIMEIIRQAQAQMKALGSMQWQNGYPAVSNIESDIAQGFGYVLEGDGVIAYGAVVFSGEPAYNSIEGAWLTDKDYVVLHRLAVADEAKRQGIAAEFMRRTEQLARTKGVGSFKVDTNFDNHYMLRLLDNLGFVYCGKIRYESGERLAFEKKL